MPLPGERGSPDFRLRAKHPNGVKRSEPRAWQRWDRPVSCGTCPEGAAERAKGGAGAFQASLRPSLGDKDGRAGQGNSRRALRITWEQRLAVGGRTDPRNSGSRHGDWSPCQKLRYRALVVDWVASFVEILIGDTDDKGFRQRVSTKVSDKGFRQRFPFAGRAHDGILPCRLKAAFRGQPERRL